MWVLDLGERIGEHLMGLAQVHVRVTVKHTVAHEVKPATEMLGLLRDSEVLGADCTGHVVPGARPCALGTFSYLVSSTSYFRLSYPNRLL